MALVPELVESFEEVEVGLHYILHVRKNAVWENKAPTLGRPVDAEDVAYNFRYASGLETPNVAAQIVRSSTYAGLQSARAVDAGTVELKLSQPNAAILFATADPRQRVIPKEMPDKLAFENSAEAPATGPFLMKEWNDGVGGSFVRNPDYWRTSNGNKLPYLDSLEFRAYGDEASQVAALLSGNLHALRLGDTALASLKNRSEIKIYSSDWRWYDVFYINGKRYPDSRIWRALQRIIDYKDLGDTTHLGNFNYSGPIDSAFPEAYQSSDIEKLPGYNPSTKAADIQEGKQMLAAAGFPDGDGFKMEWFVSSTSTSWPWNNSVIRLQQQFKPLLPKMDFTINTTPDPTWTVTRNWDATSYTIYDGPNVRFPLVALQSGASRNYASYSNPEVDALIAKAFATPQSELQGVVRQIEDILIKGGCPAIIWDSPKFQVAARTNVKGYQALLGPGSDGDTLHHGSAMKSLWFEGT
jgi:ABC-type transport system substrate-binding protein